MECEILKNQRRIRRQVERSIFIRMAEKPRLGQNVGLRGGEKRKGGTKALERLQEWPAIRTGEGG